MQTALLFLMIEQQKLQDSLHLNTSLFLISNFLFLIPYALFPNENQIWGSFPYRLRISYRHRG
jgi:hypothetical protein